MHTGMFTYSREEEKSGVEEPEFLKVKLNLTRARDFIFIRY